MDKTIITKELQSPLFDEIEWNDMFLIHLASLQQFLWINQTVCHEATILCKFERRWGQDDFITVMIKYICIRKDKTIYSAVKKDLGIVVISKANQSMP
jgi:hypothetical protein